MRVIAGKARRLQLKTVPGLDTRPTTDRIKETLFNMIQDEIYGDTRFLDLFAGSGAIGIEALSRGAGYAVFVEQNPSAAACILSNLKATKLESDARVIKQNVFTALDALRGEKPFSFVFMDPPYDQELEKEVLEKLHDSWLIDEDTLLIVEASLETSFAYLESYGYQVQKRKEYKTNVHMFLKRMPDVQEHKGE